MFVGAILDSSPDPHRFLPTHSSLKTGGEGLHPPGLGSWSARSTAIAKKGVEGRVIIVVSGLVGWNNLLWCSQVS